jgi:decaprenylphospho-beta-D-erythro-pentofuranosid-2-ulose 2-reductase
MLNAFGQPQRIVLLGGTSEIGEEILKVFSTDNTTEIVVAGRKMPESEFYSQHKALVSFEFLDVNEKDSIQQFVSTRINIREIDLAIICIGVLPPIWENLKNQEKLNFYNTNYTGTVFLMDLIASKMKKQKHGRIIVLSSVSSEFPRPSNFRYGSAKAGLDFFVRGLASELKDANVQITLLRPGYIFTRMSSHIAAAPFSKSKTYLAKSIPLIQSKNIRILYVPGILKYVFFLLKLLPRQIRNQIK